MDGKAYLVADMVTLMLSRAHPAEEVYVTGTFDNWSKSEKMDKVGDVFEKAVDLPDTSEKIYYKVGAEPVSTVCGCPLCSPFPRCAVPCHGVQTQSHRHRPLTCDT